MKRPARDVEGEREAVPPQFFLIAPIPSGFVVIWDAARLFFQLCANFPSSRAVAEQLACCIRLINSFEMTLGEWPKLNKRYA